MSQWIWTTGSSPHSECLAKMDRGLESRRAQRQWETSAHMATRSPSSWERVGAETRLERVHFFKLLHKKLCQYEHT